MKKVSSKGAKNQTMEAKRTFWLLAGVNYGVISKECQNFGLCRLDIIDQMIEKNPPKPHRAYSALALLSIHEGENQGVDFFFLKQGMSREKEKRFFEGNIFILEEDFYFEVPSLGEEPQEIVLESGIYPVRESFLGYQVKFRTITHSFREYIASSQRCS